MALLHEHGVTMTKWAVWLSMCVLLGVHLAMLVVWPWAPFQNMRLRILLTAMQKFGFAGAFLLLFAGPFLLLTIFAVIFLEVNKRATKKKRGRADLQEQPLVTQLGFDRHESFL